MIPRPVPRLVTEQKAAEQIGLDLATFRSWVGCGRGKFDLKAINAALDRISGLGNSNNALDTWREQRTARRSNAG